MAEDPQAPARHLPAPFESSDDPYRLGRRRFITAAAVAGATGAISLTHASPASAQTGLPAGASRFVPLATQFRFADTRHPSGGAYIYSFVAPNHIRVPIVGRFGIPSSATAVVLTVTVVNRSGENYVSVFPSGSALPNISNLNMAVVHEMAANLVTVQLGGGSIDVFAYKPTEMIVDVAGYYEGVSGPVESGRYVGLDSAVRIHDTRHSGLRIPLPAGWSTDVVVDGYVPPNASSVVINLTTTATGGPGYFSCYPLTQSTDSPPTDTSNLNVNRRDDTRASAAVVAVSNDGTRRGFRVYTQSGGHVIVDLVGYFTGPGAGSSTQGLFVPMSPLRVLDTRSGPKRGRLWPNWTVEARIVDVVGAPTFDLDRAQAIVANVTAVDARAPGYYTVWAAGMPRSGTSNVNASSVGQNVPNHVVTAVSNRGVAVFTETGGHVLIDIAGWFTGTPKFGTAPVNNPPPPAAGPPWSLYVPRMRLGFGGSYGLLRQVRASSNANTVVNTGNIWHWTGTGYVGQAAHIGLFGHRTEAGGPLRNQHELGNGDDIFLTVEGRPGDRRVFQYKVVREVVTGESPNQILNETRAYPGTTVSLIACTEPNQLPTNVRFRLITTAVLVAVTEDGIPV
ncbi:MAG TPA: sortase [Ilumatobacteraceae bacterium]